MTSQSAAALIIVIVSLTFILVVLANSNYFFASTNYSRYRRQIETEGNGCILPPYPDHGSWEVINGKGSPGDKVLADSVIRFHCNPGYKVSDTFLVCFKKWSSRVPECEELCPPLYSSNIYNLTCIDKIGTEVRCSEATDGTILEYTCKTFYEIPSGHKRTLFCKNGKWDPSKPVCQPVCGKKISYVKSLVVGYGATPNDKILYPWIAAVYRRFNGSYENICGASILSQTVVVTAAHCVTNDYGDIFRKEDFMVGVGKLYRQFGALKDKQAQYLGVFKIIVPEEYKGDIRKFSADIAVLVVNEEITLTDVVLPVCFKNMKNIHLHASQIGEVSGWGLAEGEIPSDVLRTLEIPYKYETICAGELPSDWADRYHLKDKICAGFVNENKSVCTGDSGSGLAFRYEEDDRYYIHGIVSLSHMVDYMCNIQQNALYTRVASYYDFIDGLLTKYPAKIKDCVLSPYPQNGKWTTDESNLKPGDLVPSDTILRIECDEGFKLSKSSVECSEAHSIPTCDKLCPKLQFPKLADYQCTDKKGQQIDCSAAIEGSNLWYRCPKMYKNVGTSTNRTCEKGSWGTPKPECIQEGCNSVVGRSNEGLEYPWNIGVYRLTDKKKKYKYICGGSLVSEFVVVTAAQCVTDEQGHPQRREDFLTAAGKLYRNYNDSRDTRAQFANLAYMIVHPRYKPSNNHFRNIALLVTLTPFALNNYVQPICLIEYDDQWWTEEDPGLMIGWRFSESLSPETVQPLEVVNLQNTDCQDDVLLVRRSLTFDSDKMCTGFKNRSICLLPEDSGKGIIRKHAEDGRYYLRGVATFYSHSKKNLDHFFVTGIQPYTDFIYSLVLFLK